MMSTNGKLLPKESELVDGPTAEAGPRKGEHVTNSGSSPAMGENSAVASMTSDGIVSQAILSEDVHVQPANLWYSGGRTRRNSKQSVAVDDTSVESDEQPKLTPSPAKAKKFKFDTEEVDTEEVDISFPLAAGGPPPPPSLPFSPPAEIPDGSGTVIAILDSGINATHISFQGKVHPQSRSFVSDDINDIHGHGTQCAGIACGTYTPVQINTSGQVIQWNGIATGAKVLVCKVVPDGAKEADIEAVCNAIDYILQYNSENPQQGINVVSLSFGMPHYHGGMCKKILLLLHSNVIVVCAASNDGRTSSQPVSYPARMGDVLCIGASKADSGEAAKFSPVGREVDFLAPGKNIWAPTIGGECNFVNVSGTSCAAPAVAGLVCQIIEDFRVLSPDALDQLHNVWVMREVLKAMATVQGHHDEKRGFGVLEPLKYFEKSSYEKIRLLKKIVEP